MTNKYVLDASALLALVNKENGYEKVAEVAASSVMSTVNVSESISALKKHGIEANVAKNLINDILSHIVPFEMEHALITAQLTQQTSKYGLSLGDRACLSTALHLNLPVLTADKLWSKLKIDISIEMIR